MISRQREGVVLAPLAWNLCDVASDLAAEQRRRRPRLFTHQPPALRRTPNVSSVPKPSAAIRRRRDRTRFVASIVRRRLNRCRNPWGAWDLSVARSWPSRCDDCSSVFGRSGSRSSQCAPRSGNEAGGSIQTAIRVAPRKRQLLRQHDPDARAISPGNF